MRRFQFRLERFLELRRWKEREWELALAKVQGECLLLENRIIAIGEEIGTRRLQGFAIAGTDQGRQVIDMEQMTRLEFYFQRLAVERERAKEKLVELRKELEKVRAKYLEASRARKVLDKLKERRSAEYYEKALDEEFKTADDLNTSAAARR